MEITREELIKRKEKAQNDKYQLVATLNALEGAIQAYQQLIQLFDMKEDENNGKHDA